MPAKQWRWGFKAECNARARELREELGVQLHDPLCPWELCEHLSIPIVKLHQLEPLEHRAYLAGPRGREEFSAAVFYDGPRAFVLLNDTHSRKRLAADLAHEVAHIVLHHPPRPLFVAGGVRSFSPEHEDEAEWLGPALLVSEEAALHAYRLMEDGEATLEQLSNRWTVSTNVIRMRINVVGAARRSQRSA